MRLTHILPYAVLILLGEAAIGSVPGIVAAREGGMGLGSALIMAQAAQVAGMAFGAILAAHLVDRWSVHVAWFSVWAAPASAWCSRRPSRLPPE